MRKNYGYVNLIFYLFWGLGILLLLSQISLFAHDNSQNKIIYEIKESKNNENLVKLFSKNDKEFYILNCDSFEPTLIFHHDEEQLLKFDLSLLECNEFKELVRLCLIESGQICIDNNRLKSLASCDCQNPFELII